MPKRLLRRALIVAVSPIVIVAFLLASTTTASAHEVTNITATCDSVTVFFSGFPQSGVDVHIAAAVEGHGTLSKDVVVNDMTTQASLDISSATNTLFGATANADVDVTWTFEGPQHVDKSLSVTCGNATTTSTTMVGVSGESSTTIEQHATTTTSPEVVVSGNATSTTASGVLGASANASPASFRRTGSGSSLPFTGSGTDALVIVGLAALGAGSGLVVSQRRRSATS